MFAGAPPDINKYQEFQVDGLKVYLSKDARLDGDSLKISLRGIGPWRRLVVHGLVR